MKISRVLLTSFLFCRRRKGGRGDGTHSDWGAFRIPCYPPSKWLLNSARLQLFTAASAQSKIQELILRGSSWNNWRSDSQILPGMFESFRGLWSFSQKEKVMFELLSLPRVKVSWSLLAILCSALEGAAVKSICQETTKYLDTYFLVGLIDMGCWAFA